jgi:hypothetical protein
MVALIVLLLSMMFGMLRATKQMKRVSGPVVQVQVPWGACKRSVKWTQVSLMWRTET